MNDGKHCIVEEGLMQGDIIISEGAGMLRDEVNMQIKKETICLKLKVFIAILQKQNVVFYAGKLCITPKYLISVVKKASGKIPTDWIKVH